MPEIVLKAQSLQATFDPDHGMRLTSFRKGRIEVIAESAGAVGPHFGALHPGVNPQRYVDGIARYAPWKTSQVSENTIHAQLTGKDDWNGKTVGSLEGQAFKMEMIASLHPEHLTIQVSVVADADALAGYGCYFKLGKGLARVISDVQDQLLERTGYKSMPVDWDYNDQKRLNIPLDRTIDTIFHPAPNPLTANLKLETAAYQLQLRYHCQNAENSWQLTHHPDKGTVYLAALAAKSPFRPVLTVNSIKMELAIQ